MDQQRSYINEVRRRIHLGLLQTLHVGQKLGRDATDGDVIDIDVLLADQVPQQVQRTVVPLPHRNAVRRCALGSFPLLRLLLGFLALSPTRFFAHSARSPGSGSTSCMASLTCSMVCSARTRASSEPLCRMSCTRRGCSSYCLRRSCMGCSSATMASAAQPLHSMQPMPADRQPA